jgi:hypothetical protein
VNVWRGPWVLLAAIAVAAPGCLLVQPLDDVNSDSAGAGGKAGGGGKASTGGNTSSAGKGGSGATPTGGRGGSAPTAGGPPSGVDFSYFVDTWTVTSGTISTDCGTGPTDAPATVGSTDTVTLGTTSDLIVDEGTPCPVLADVNDLVATGQDGQTCDFTDGSNNYQLVIDAFTFVVSGNHLSATSELYGEVTDTVDGIATTCGSHQILHYTH